MVSAVCALTGLLVAKPRRLILAVRALTGLLVAKPCGLILAGPPKRSRR